MNINTFLESLANNPSRNFKIDQLSAHRDNETLREVVHLALDPFTQFYQRKIPKYTPNTNNLGDNLDWALEQLVTMLASRNVTGNDAIEHLQYVLENVTADNAKVVERVIQKDLKCGVQVSTANTVWHNLVAEYPCMLCSPFEKKLVDKITFPAYAQLKMDGMRFNAIVKHTEHNVTVELRSRNGKELHVHKTLDQAFIEMAGGIDYVFDGEMLIEDSSGAICDRQTGNGILNKANKGTMSTAEADMVRATVWDMIPFRNFQAGLCNITYEMRFQLLSSMLLPEKVRLVEHTVVYDLEAAQTIFEEYLVKGQEGIILKDPQGFWENKRAKHQIKFKGELECDLKIVGTEGGTGKYEGMLGAIICESSDSVVKTRVGSGFNDQQRRELTSEDLVGRIVAVKYNMRSVDKQGNHSLFLPIFLELRADKDIADPASLIT